MQKRLSEVSTLVGLPPPLRGRVGERGKPRALTEEIQQARAVDPVRIAVVLRPAAEQAAPLSLTLSRKGRGNPPAGASLTDAHIAESLAKLSEWSFA
jgi:hypothetical protein